VLSSAAGAGESEATCGISRPPDVVPSLAAADGDTAATPTNNTTVAAEIPTLLLCDMIVPFYSTQILETLSPNSPIWARATRP